MEIGIYTFGDLPAGARGPHAAQQRIQEIVAAAKLADVTRTPNTAERSSLV